LSSKILSFFLLIICLATFYSSNGSYFLTKDGEGNTYLPISLLQEGNLTFHPAEVPFLFNWVWHPEEGYINTFGLGAGLTALPVMAGVKMIFSDFAADPQRIHWIAKWIAALCVAISAGFIFLSASLYLPHHIAFIPALVFGLATCAWGSVAQTLWQHGPSIMWLAAASYVFLRQESYPTHALVNGIIVGLCLGMAVLCRPTGLFFVLTVGIYWGLYHRRAMLGLIVGGLCPAIVLLGYQGYYFGNPFSFPQTLANQQLALQMTGSAEIWQTPLLEGLAGLLVSPARGLFYYSPVLLFSLIGIGVSVYHRRFRPLWPWMGAACAVIVSQSLFFQWWGGIGFGYRPIVDVTFIFAMLIIPAMPWVYKLHWLFITLFVYSVGVQGIGAYAFSRSWDEMTVYQIQLPQQTQFVYAEHELERDAYLDQGGKITAIIPMSIQHRQYRYRLWSWSDQPLRYFIDHFAQAVTLKQQQIDRWNATLTPQNEG